jgi:hypothetical protein
MIIFIAYIEFCAEHCLDEECGPNNDEADIVKVRIKRIGVD